jgi:hypothetical protein
MRKKKNNELGINYKSSYHRTKHELHRRGFLPAAWNQYSLVDLAVLRPHLHPQLVLNEINFFRK